MTEEEFKLEIRLLNAEFLTLNGEAQKLERAIVENLRSLVGSGTEVRSVE